MATVTQAPGLSTPSMLGNPDGGAPAAATDQSAPCATGGEVLEGEGRLRKGKMVAEDQSSPSVSGGVPADLPPGGDKLAENGGDTDTLLLGARRPWMERMVGPTILFLFFASSATSSSRRTRTKSNQPRRRHVGQNHHRNR